MFTELAQFEKETKRNENRRHKRVALAAHYEIAACRGNDIPDSEYFFGIQCTDISASGFSFVSERLPALKFVVLRMRFQKRRAVLKAKIMNHRQNPDGSYVVGCMFIERF